LVSIQQKSVKVKGLMFYERMSFIDLLAIDQLLFEYAICGIHGLQNMSDPMGVDVFVQLILQPRSEHEYFELVGEHVKHYLGVD